MASGTALGYDSNCLTFTSTENLEAFPPLATFRFSPILDLHPGHGALEKLLWGWVEFPLLAQIRLHYPSNPGLGSLFLAEASLPSPVLLAFWKANYIRQEIAETHDPLFSFGSIYHWSFLKTSAHCVKIENIPAWPVV